MKSYVIALEPEMSLFKKILSIKKESYSLVNGKGKYILDPPHLTLYVGRFKNFLNRKFEELIKRAEKELGEIIVDIDNLDVFENDKITGLNTIHFQIKNKKIIDLQKKIIAYLDKFRGKELVKRYKIGFRDRKLKENLNKYGYPYVGNVFLPHISIGSFEEIDTLKIKEIALNSEISGKYYLQYIVIYELNEENDSLEKVKSLKFRDLTNLKKEVCQGNKLLKANNLVKLTWGNLSCIDKSREFVLIKPSGVDYDSLSYRDISVVKISNGEVIEGLKPSSDTKTHIEIYKNFDGVYSIVHTHSTYATMFCQALKPIKCYGTTHADYFKGEIPVVYKISKEKIRENYEKNTGKLIVKYFKDKKIPYKDIPACLLPSHGPFIWANSIKKAIENAVVLEEISKINLGTEKLNPNINQIDFFLLNKHYQRKNGKNRSYGQ